MNLGIAAGGFAQGLQQGAGVIAQASNALNYNKIVQIEQQKQNLQGYQTFRDMINTMDPDTLKAMWPNVAKTLFNVDPGDAGTKAFYMQAIDKNTQIGQTVQKAFSSMTTDPNDPIANVMKNIPIQSLAAMSKDPSKLVTFISGVNSLSMMRQTQGIVTAALGSLNGEGGGQAPAQPAAQPQPSAPAPAPNTLQANVSPAVPAPVPATAPPATGTLAANVQPQAQPQPQPQAAPVAAPAPQAPGITSTGGPLPSATTGPAALAASVDRKRKLGFIMSMSPVPSIAKAGEVLSGQANAEETNYMTAQRNAIEAGRVNVEQQQANIAAKRLSLETGDKTWKPDTSLPSQPGITVLKNGNGDFKTVVTAPAMQDWYKGQADIANKEYTAARDVGMQATTDLRSIQELRAIQENPATKPPTGTFSTPLYFAGKLADSLGMPDIAKSIYKSAPGAEVSDAIMQQMALKFGQRLRQGSMGSFSEAFINNVEESFPELTDTQDGRNFLLDVMDANAKVDQGVYDIWQNHIKEAPGYLPDKSGKTADQQVMDFLKSQQGVPQQLQQRLDALSGAQPTTLGGNTTPSGGYAPAPKTPGYGGGSGPVPSAAPLSKLSPNQFIDLLNKVP